MSFWRDPRALHADWNPPALVGRQALLRELGELLPVPCHSHARATLVLWGSRGAGTSSVAQHFVRRAHDMWWNSYRASPPLLLRADLSAGHSPCAAVGSLFRGIDPDFETRGSSTELLSLLLLRRIRTLHRPTLIWLDQVREGSPGTSRVLRPLLEPGRMLPEGDAGLPPYVVVTSGEVDPTSDLPELAEARSTFPFLRRRLPALSPEEVLQALENRARAAFALPPEPEALIAIGELLLSRGWGLGLAAATLEASARRAQARGSSRLGLQDVAPPSDPVEPRRTARALDSCIVESLVASLPGRAQRGISLRELRRNVQERCRREGIGVPSPARLWRHTIRLERSGILRREVRIGGRGGSSSRFLLPDLPSPCPPVSPGENPSPLAPTEPSGPAPPTPAAPVPHPALLTGPGALTERSPSTGLEPSLLPE